MARPTKMTPECIGKLEQAFAKGLNDTEACLLADICADTLDSYEAKHPEFVDKKKRLRSKPLLKAKLNIVDSVEAGDIGDSKWLLERRDPDFKNISKQEHTGNVGLTLLEQIMQDEGKE